MARQPVRRTTSVIIITSAPGTEVRLHGNDIWLTCSCCLREQPIQAFGFRTMTGKDEVRNQPWCSPCRGDA